jgi:hypothetical protein
MIEQIAADACRLSDHIDAVLVELVAVTDSREHQQLRTVDRASAQHHLTSCPDHLPASAFVVLDADGAAPFEDHLRRSGLGQQSQVRALERGPQVGIGGAPPGTAALRYAGFAEAFRLSLIGLLNSISAFLDGL